MRYKTLPLLVLAFFAVGCMKDIKTFNVSVKNDTDWPLTLNLTKNVPQHEYYWTSPEDQVTARVIVNPDVPPGGTDNDLQPGEVKHFGWAWGHFPDDVRAILRINRGKNLSMHEKTLVEVGPHRQDVQLKPGGDNDFVVHDVDGKLTVERIEHKS